MIQEPRLSATILHTLYISLTSHAGFKVKKCTRPQAHVPKDNKPTQCIDRPVSIVQAKPKCLF